MLDLMRKHARSWLIKVALGGIIIVFVFWYGWSGPGEQTRNYAASVNGTIISYGLFYNVYESEMAKMRLRFKGALPQELLDKLNLKEKVVQGLVDQMLLMQEAQRLGMFVTDEDLIQAIQSNQLFQRNGVFDSRIYAAYLRSIKLSPEFYESTQRHQLLATQLVKVLTDGVKADPEEIKRLWHFQNDKLVLSMLLVKPVPETSTPSPEAVESYFGKNRAKYEFPATVDLKYVVISWRDLKKKVQVSDKEARAYYDSHPSEFLVPRRIKARHILLRVPQESTEEMKKGVLKKAEDLLARIKGGEKFETVARAESEDQTTASKGGDLGFFSQGTMDPQLEQAAFKLEVGQTSEPVLTREGYHIIRVDEITPEKELDFLLAKDKILEKLTEQAARNRVIEVADDFYEQVYRSEDLEGQARAFGFKAQKGQALTKSGGLPEVGMDPNVMEEAFQLRTGEISRLLKSGDNYVIMQLVDNTAERLPTLDEVRRSVEKDYLQQKALENAEKKAKEIIEDLARKSSDPQKVAEKFGMQWKDLDPISRTTGFVPELGNAPLVKELLTTLSMSSPLFHEPVPVTQGVAVVRLQKVDEASESKYEEEAPSFEKWVLEVRKTDFLKGWLRKLRDKAEIEINDKLL